LEFVRFSLENCKRGSVLGEENDRSRDHGALNFAFVNLLFVLRSVEIADTIQHAITKQTASIICCVVVVTKMTISKFQNLNQIFKKMNINGTHYS
jgi:predicted permease